MNTSRKTAIVVGIFFLTAMVTYLLGASMIESITGTPDYLVAVSENKTLVIFGSAP
jgi:uncharacterized protein YlzI (FlbEa/FlbD family)